MRYEEQDVKSKVQGEVKVVGIARFPVYDSIDEARGEEGEEKCLEYINAQRRTNELNKVRAEARTGPSKTKLRSEAITRITPEEWQQIAGDAQKIESLLEAKMDEIEKEWETRVGVPVGADDNEESD